MVESERKRRKQKGLTMNKIIYEWVKENYGESEADNPSWDIEALAKHIQSKLKEKNQ